MPIERSRMPRAARRVSRLAPVVVLVLSTLGLARVNAQSDPRILTFPGSSYVATQFDAPGERVLIAAPRELRVWPLDGSAPDVLRMPKEHPCSSAFFAGRDGPVVVVTRYAVFAWHVSSKRVERLYETDYLPDDEQPKGRNDYRRRLRTAGCSPDGRFVAVFDRKRLTVLPVAGGEPTTHEVEWNARFTWHRPTGDLLFFNDGTLFRVPQNGNGTPEKIVAVDMGWMSAVRCSPDGSKLVVGGRRVMLVDLADKTVTTMKRRSGWMSTTAFTKDGRLFTADYDGVFRVDTIGDEDAAIRVKLRRVRTPAAAISPAGDYFAATVRSRRDGRTTTRIWSVAAEPKSWSLPGALREAGTIRFSEDGGRLLVAYRDGHAEVYRVADLVKGTPSSKAGGRGIDVRVRTLGDRIRLICNGKRLGQNIDASMAALPAALMALPPARRRYARIDTHDDTPQVVRLAIYKACLEAGVTHVVWKDKRKPDPRPRRGASLADIVEAREQAKAREAAAKLAAKDEAKAKEKEDEKARPARPEQVPLPTVEAFEDDSFRSSLVRVDLKMAGIQCEVRMGGEVVGTGPTAAADALERFKAKRKESAVRAGRRYDLELVAGPRVPIHLIVAASDPFIMDGVTAILVRGGDR